MSNADKPAFAQSMAFDSEGHGYAAMEKDPSLAGMTKREYFAAIAMQGLLAANSLEHISQFRSAEYKSHTEMLALASVNCADSLLKQLEK